jgi:metal-responsive CopG/Arc/MetJ family transcriptional regulator
MPSRSAKIAMSIPSGLYESVERFRKKTGQSRSGVLQDALHYWLQRQEEVALIRKYEKGYRRKPETRSEVRGAEASAVRLLGDVEW